MIDRPEGSIAYNPFKAYQSYGPADGDLFFGRDVEGISLCRFFQDRPLAVLTAASGIGKTSLLNASVIPLLERQRWSPAYSRPNDDPIESLRNALAEYLFPDPEIEAGVIERLSRAMADNNADLQSALAWHEKLPLERRVDLRLFLPLSSPDFSALPVMCRALRGSMACDDVIEHFEALVAAGKPLGLAAHTKLGELVRLLRESETCRLREDWRTRFRAAPTLGAMLALLDDEWLPLRPGTTGILLILDQFEELFTRLAPAKFDTLIEEAEHLLSWCTMGQPQPHSKPVHLAFSLRKEFFADLLPRLHPFGPAERITFFLGPMALPAARLAMQKPARLFGIDFKKKTLDRVLAFTLDEGTASDAYNVTPESLTLPKGNRYSPALISLLGAHLWKTLHGRPDLESNARESTPGQQLDWEGFCRLIPDFDNVFGSYLAETLAAIDTNGANNIATRFDALELLDRLVTVNGFRQIVSEEELIARFPLNKEAVRTLLTRLDHDAKLIRRESRRGGRVVEIMHERLIPPVRSMLLDLRTRETNRAALQPAHDMLLMLPDEPIATNDPLPAHFRDVLTTHVDRLDLTPLSAKILLRSVLVAGPRVTQSVQAQAAQTHWSTTVRTLAKVMEASAARTSHRTMILTGDQVDKALAALDAGNAANWESLYNIGISALADCSENANGRIRRIFAHLVAVEHRP